MKPKTRHTGAEHAAHALPSIRRADAKQVLVAIAAIVLTIGSAVMTKRITAAPAPLASVVTEAPRRPVVGGAAPRELRGIPAVSLVQRSKSGGPAIVDPLRQSTLASTIMVKGESSALEFARVIDGPARAAAVAGGDRLLTPPAGFERYYNGRPLRRARTMSMTVTAYSPDHRSCGPYADGITASGMSVWTNGMNLVAADPRVLPRHSLITVPGYADDSVVPVLDVGGAIKGRRLDVLYPSHAVARQWGVQRLNIIVWEYADE